MEDPRWSVGFFLADFDLSTFPASPHQVLPDQGTAAGHFSGTLVTGMYLACLGQHELSPLVPISWGREPSAHDGHLPTLTLALWDLGLQAHR